MRSLADAAPVPLRISDSRPLPPSQGSTWGESVGPRPAAAPSAAEHAADVIQHGIRLPLVLEELDIGVEQVTPAPGGRGAAGQGHGVSDVRQTLPASTPNPRKRNLRRATEGRSLSSVRGGSP